MQHLLLKVLHKNQNCREEDLMNSDIFHLIAYEGLSLNKLIIVDTSGIHQVLINYIPRQGASAEANTF